MNFIDEFTYDYFKKFFNNKQIVLFGASEFGKFIYEYLIHKNMEIIYFCDNNEEKWGGEFCGLPVISPTQLKNICDENISVLIASSYHIEIENQLKKMGIYNVRYLSKDTYKIYFEDSKNILKNKSYIQQLIDILYDKKSINTIKGIIKYILTGKIEFINNISVDNQYFQNKLLNISSNEIFVDAGAFTGDTIEKFLQITNYKFRKIVAFEPEKNNFKKLNEYISNLNVKEKIQLFNCGLYKENSKMQFIENIDSASRIFKDNNEDLDKLKVAGVNSIEYVDSIDVISLDNLFNCEEITFIKMDIEGAEKDALLGAQNIIKLYKPKLAICIYHDVLEHKDLWEIPFFIKSLVPQYKLYIRHHSKETISETVCYATID
ncbi:FkbM family methyltransferase [Clostridium botulinum]|uniref:FkbM family methyltransferase n=1 Tax=Clostridium botulinum TaxID=1491 RepID=UPI003DA5A631